MAEFPSLESAALFSSLSDENGSEVAQNDTGDSNLAKLRADCIQLEDSVLLRGNLYN